MTCNQLMVLLDVYRGTLDHGIVAGTLPEDLRALHARGLINPDTGNDDGTGHWYTTVSGDAHVRLLLSIEKVR